MPLTLLAALAVTVLSAAPVGGPTLAVEDTMHTQVAPVLVHAPRVTLSEILDRVARGEARRDSLMQDQTFLFTTRFVRGTAEKNAAPMLLFETVSRVYKKRPDKSRTQVLRNYRAFPKKKGSGGIDVTMGPGMNEDIVNFAFQPSSRRDYRYRILGRDLAGDHLIYRLGFEPRSLLDPGAPHGSVWIDTNDFVIVRQEVGFAHSPAPPLLKSVDRMVIERENVTGYWVLRRVLMRAELGVPLPKFGRSFDMSLQFDQYAINTGLPDSLFVRSGAGK